MIGVIRLVSTRTTVPWASPLQQEFICRISTFLDSRNASLHQRPKNTWCGELSTLESIVALMVLLMVLPLLVLLIFHNTTNIYLHFVSSTLTVTLYCFSSHKTQKSELWYLSCTICSTISTFLGYHFVCK